MNAAAPHPLAAVVEAAAYRLAQGARVAWHTGHYIASRRAMGPAGDPAEVPPAKASAPLDRRRLTEVFFELFERDWRNVERGAYRRPLETRRTAGLRRLLGESRDYFADVGAVAARRRRRGHSEVMRDDRHTDYPRYYLQNFHYQSDGWLSDASAARYEMQVETLFTGAAGAMRRQALPFLREAMAGRDPASLSLVDIGCGEGGFLEDVLDNWPSLRATGVDLSPAYLGRALARLSRFPATRLLRAPAEATGLADASADMATAVYLFHELPPKARKAVATEIGRILKPGGLFVLVDTLQYGDEPGLDVLLESFPQAVHEPYYDSYCRTDLGAMFAEAGLRRLPGETPAFLSKVTAFVKTP